VPLPWTTMIHPRTMNDGKVDSAIRAGQSSAANRARRSSHYPDQLGEGTFLNEFRPPLIESRSKNT